MVLSTVRAMMCYVRYAATCYATAGLAVVNIAGWQYLYRSEVAIQRHSQLLQNPDGKVFARTNFRVLDSIVKNVKMYASQKFPAIQYLNTSYGKGGVYFVQPFWI